MGGFPVAEREDENAVVEDFAEALKLYADGSTVRTDHLIINVPPSEEDTCVASRDVVINEELGIWVRIYLPLSLVNTASTCFSRLPVLLYLHGGGFCFLSPAFIVSHRFCLKWASTMGAIVVSVNYRLAPEHRLPAAYDDSMEVVEWLRSSRHHSDPWLNAYANFSNVFLVGESCGGNIVHHLLMRTVSAFRHDDEFGIRGAILLQPFFGGEQRTQSEIVCPADVQVNLKVCDTFWRLALTNGCNRDHPFSNPVKYLELQLQMPLPPMLVVLGGKDCLRDRGVEYYEAVRKSGKCKHVDLILFEEEEHGFHHSVKEEEAADHNLNSSNNKLMRQAALFVSSNCTDNQLGSF